MNRLVINTANDELDIVLEKDGEIFSSCLTSRLHHNETMLPAIDELLKCNNVDVTDIDEFGVVIGPGSFTGLRVGISTIKAMRDATDKKAKGINNLDLLFKTAKIQNPEIETCAILGSKDSYFVAKYINGEVYKYDRNVTLNELKQISDGKLVAMYTEDNNIPCYVVKTEPKVLLECLSESNDYDIVPVYYQLSQAESEKLKKLNVRVEEATLKDLVAISKIEAESIKTNVISEKEIDEMFLNKNYHTFVVKADDEVVGYEILQITDEVNIVSIAVNKKFRNLGLATKLIDTAKQYAKDLLLTRVSLEVSKKNITAYLLYLKNGFVVRRERKNYYADGADCLEMVVVL